MKRPLSCLQDHARVFLCEMSVVAVENLSNTRTPWCRRPCVEVEMAPSSSGKAYVAATIPEHL